MALNGFVLHEHFDAYVEYVRGLALKFRPQVFNEKSFLDKLRVGADMPRLHLKIVDLDCKTVGVDISEKPTVMCMTMKKYCRASLAIISTFLLKMPTNERQVKMYLDKVDSIAKSAKYDSCVVLNVLDKKDDDDADDDDDDDHDDPIKDQSLMTPPRSKAPKVWTPQQRASDYLKTRTELKLHLETETHFNLLEKEKAKSWTEAEHGSRQKKIQSLWHVQRMVSNTRFPFRFEENLLRAAVMFLISANKQLFRCHNHEKTMMVFVDATQPDRVRFGLCVDSWFSKMDNLNGCIINAYRDFVESYLFYKDWIQKMLSRVHKTHNSVHIIEPVRLFQLRAGEAMRMEGDANMTLSEMIEKMTFYWMMPCDDLAKQEDVIRQFEPRMWSLNETTPTRRDGIVYLLHGIIKVYVYDRHDEFRGVVELKSTATFENLAQECLKRYKLEVVEFRLQDARFHKQSVLCRRDSEHFGFSTKLSWTKWCTGPLRVVIMTE